MSNNTEKRVRRQQKKANHSSQLNMAPSSPPTSPQDGTMTTRWGNKNIDGGSEDDTTTEKQRGSGAWMDSSKRKLSPRSSAPDGPTAADPFAGMKTCINYQQEIERLKTLVPKVENKKRSSQQQQQQQQQQHHQRNNSATVIITEGNMMDTDNNNNNNNNTDNDTIVMAPVPAAASTTNTTNTTTALPPTDHTTTSNISSTTKMTSVPSSSSSSSSSSHISSNSSSSSLSSSHDSMLSSSLSSACSPPSSLHSVIPPTSHSSMMSHEMSPSTLSTPDHLVELVPTTTTNHLMESPNNTTSPKMEKKTGSTSVITDEEKTRFLEFMRSWTGGLNGWNDQPIEHKGFMWNQQQQPSRQPQLWTRSEPCSPLHHDVRMDPWSPQQQQQKQQHHHSHPPPHHHHQQYLQQQFHQQLPPTNIQLNMGHRQQPCFTPTSPALQSPLSSKPLQQPLLYPSSTMHPQQKQQASFHHQQQYQHHTSQHLHYHQLQQPHSLHQQQPQQPPAPMTSKEWHGSSGIKFSSSILSSQVGTIGDRSSSPSVSRTPRNHGPLSVSVM